MSLTGRRFAGAAVLITGGAHGIGKACAVRMAAEGARCAVADVDGPAAGQVVEQLGGAAAGHVAVVIDVTQTASVDQAVAASVVALGAIDVLANVAGGDTDHGVTDHGVFEEIGDQTWLNLPELNLLSVARCCRAAIPHLRRSLHHPAIVNVSSINAHRLGKRALLIGEGRGRLAHGQPRRHPGRRGHPRQRRRPSHHQDPGLARSSGRRGPAATALSARPSR